MAYEHVVNKKKCKCNLYFKSVYQLQETRATKATNQLLTFTDPLG